jgi:hypothetical protein
LNTISELGQTVTYSGEPNTVSMILFVCFFLVWAVAIIAFFAVFPSFFTKSRIAKWVSIIGSAFALISGGATFGVVLPMNLYGSIHFICSMIMYIAILLSQIFSAIAIFLSKRFPKKYGVFLLISALIIIIFIFIFIHFLAAPIMEIYVVGQKVITYAILTAIGATAYGAWKLNAKTTA